MFEWYEWNTVEEFNTWHNSIKEKLGLPKPGINQATGEIDQNAEWTKDYTSVIKVNNKFIARVDNQFNKDLIKTDLRPPIPDIP